MPQVKMPDGQTVEMPDELTPELATRLKALNASQPSFFDNLKDKAGKAVVNTIGSVAEPLAKLATSAVALPISGLAQANALASNLAGFTNLDTNKVGEDVTNALTYKPVTPAGMATNNPLNAVPEIAMGGLQKVGNALASGIERDNARYSGGSAGGQAMADIVRNGVPLALGAAIPGMAGRYVKPAVTAVDNFISKPSEASIKAVQASPQKLDAARIARDRGLALPLQDVNPSIANQSMSVIPGPTSIAHEMYKKNKPIVENMAREDMGIPANKPLNAENIDAVRKQAAQPYEEIRGIKQFSADEQFNNDINGLSDLSGNTPAVQEILKNKVPELVDKLKAASDKGLNGNDVVDLMKGFRQDANAVLGNRNIQNPGDLAIANAQRSAAKAIEGLVDRNLANMEAANPGVGYGDLANRFREGRKTIAKTHTWQKYLNEQTGDIDVNGLMKEGTGHNAMTGSLSDLVKVASNYPEVFTPPSKLGGSAFGPFERITHGIDILTKPLTKIASSDFMQNRNIAGLDPRNIRERMGYTPEAPQQMNMPSKQQFMADALRRSKEAELAANNQAGAQAGLRRGMRINGDIKDINPAQVAQAQEQAAQAEILRQAGMARGTNMANTIAPEKRPVGYNDIVATKLMAKKLREGASQ